MSMRTAGYRPADRRPIAAAFRATAQSAVQACLKHGIHPDWISYASMAAAAGAGLCFWQAHAAPALLIPAVLLCMLRLWLNMLDGMVALSTGKASLRGELLNDLPDRVSDVIIFAGVAHSGLCHPLSAYWAAIGALLVAYVGLFGQALGGRRQFGGVMSKPWRMAMLTGGALITLGLLWWRSGQIQFWGLTVLDWTSLAIIAGCLQTLWVRLARILRTLDETVREARESGTENRAEP